MTQLSFGYRIRGLFGAIYRFLDTPTLASEHDNFGDGSRNRPTFVERLFLR